MTNSGKSWILPLDFRGAEGKEWDCVLPMPVQGRADLRWRVMLESGSREGEELRRVWDKLRQEEVQAAAWLDEEVHSSFQVEVEGVGVMEALVEN